MESLSSNKIATLILAIAVSFLASVAPTAHSFGLQAGVVPAKNFQRGIGLGPLRAAATDDGDAATPAADSSAADSESTSEKPKKQKKKKKQQQQQPAPMVLDVSKLDVRVGEIQKCWEHPEADKLYCEEIDLGEESGPRSIASGLRAHYSVEEMVGKKVLVLANLKSRKLVGFPSHGMVLCACEEKEDGSGKVEFVVPPSDAVIGERVLCEGFDDGEPATENQVVKKKILQAVLPELAVNDRGIATYRGEIPLRTTAGPCVAESLKNAPIS